MVLQLCCSVGNLEALVQNASLMSLLSRLLESEHKSSLEMTYNIVRCFLAFSSFQVRGSLFGHAQMESSIPSQSCVFLFLKHIFFELLMK